MDKKMISLGERMKSNYEKTFNYQLPKRMPVIIRLDGKAFHTLTRKYFKNKPFDSEFIEGMNIVAKCLCEQIQGCELAYIQSDEISLLLHNYKRFSSDAWFDNKIQKIVSVSASIASSIFSRYLFKLRNKDDLSLFDSRCFVLPEQEVCNYFIWRQKDWERNSIQMLARSLYSNKECFKKSHGELHEMIFQKGENWANYATALKRGRCIKKNDGNWELDNEIPIFIKEHNYINSLLACEE